MDLPKRKGNPRPAQNTVLNEAIPGHPGDRNVDYVKTLFVVHDGAIYAAQTSDGGVTYHGYPYKGKIPGDVMVRLELMAAEKDCEKEFRKRVKSHIMRHGERR